MRKLYFYLPEYPGWTTGGHKYHKMVFEYFKKNRKDVFFFGNTRFNKYVDKSKVLKVITGIAQALKIPRKSVIVYSNTSFVHCFLPVIFNRLWKNHFYFLIVHHLVQDERNSYLRRKLENYFLKKSDKIVTVSQTSQKKLYDLNIGLRNIEIVNPGLDVRNENIPTRNLCTGKLKLLYIGTIEERKGVSYVIDALGKLKLKEFEFNIVGEPAGSEKYFYSVKQKIDELSLNDKVVFKGKVNKYELEKIYKSSNIFIFPSLWEGYGMVVAEAMAYGLPVIATEIPTTKELIDNGINGLLVKPKDSNEIAEKINLLFTNAKMLEELARNAYFKSKTFPTWDESCKVIYEIVNRLEK